MAHSQGNLWLSQRVMWTAMEDENRAGKLIELFKTNRGAVDDVWIFTENDGQDFRYIPIEEVRERGEIMAKRMRQLREAGLGASINVLNTIGHSDYADPFLDPLPWGGVTGPDGAVSTCCSCPRQPKFREYVREKYSIYAACQPEWIWVDDDVRLFGHFWRVMHGCFCDICVEEFSRRTDRNWDREGIYSAVVRNDYPAANPDRDTWMHYLSDQIVEIHELIREAVHAVDPEIGLGGMNTQFGWNSAYYSRFKDRFEALRFSKNRTLRVRPGGGFFTDERPLEVFQKAWGVAFQNTQYPENTERHAEVENYPFQMFEKSVASTLRETSLFLAAGSEGVGYDISGNLGNDPQEHVSYLAGISQRRNYFEAIRRTLAGGKPVGLNVAFHPEHAALAPSDGEKLESTDASQFVQACGWGFLGIPLRFSGETEGPSILHGQLAKGLPADTLAKILTRGVVMDHEALEHLWTVGLGEIMGVKIDARYETGTFERMTDHPLNEGFNKYTREVSQGYYPAESVTLKSAGRKFSPLSKLYSYRKEELGICSATVETAEGARIVILGYRPWDYVGLPGKASQSRRISDWLLGGNSFRLAQGGKSVVFASERSSGGHAACFYNASEDPIDAPVFQGLEGGQRLDLQFPDGSSSQATASANGEVTLPPLVGWGECLLTW